MGSFFTSSQIYNSKQFDKEGFIDFFCKRMEANGYVSCSSDESEISYILRFADNTKWVTITSEAYEQGNQFSQTDTGRIAEMLNTTCINTIVVDSDFAILDLYDESGQKADSLIIGRADDYLGDDISQPLEKTWTPFLEDNFSFTQLLEVQNGDYVFIEDGLTELADIIGIDKRNITFSEEDAVENDKDTVFLDFKEARSSIVMTQAGEEVTKAPKKISVNAAFKQIIGKALEPYGFKCIKGRHPYIVRVINNEILHIITFCPENPEYPEDKAISIRGGVASIYRKKITFDLTPKENHEWLNYLFKFYTEFTHEINVQNRIRLFKTCFYSDNPDSLISALQVDAENIIKYALPIMDKINDIDSCLNYMQEFKAPCNYKRCEEICTYYPDDDEAFLYFLSSKYISERPDFLTNYINDTEFHSWVITELEKRKNDNLEILKEYGLISEY